VLAGRYDHLFPTEHQVALAAGIKDARLEVIECAGHNPHSEEPDQVLPVLRNFLSDEKHNYVHQDSFSAATVR
jgi:pimeloyl-ACP methyl ester carboxylesterase